MSTQFQEKVVFCWQEVFIKSKTENYKGNKLNKKGIEARSPRVTFFTPIG